MLLFVTAGAATIEQRYPTSGKPWENTLGMKFVPLPGTNVLFGVSLVREKDYEAFVRAKSVQWPRHGGKHDPTFPAVNMSWPEAKDFCVWLTEAERSAGRLSPEQKYRLPSDAEWSVAVGLNESDVGTPKDKHFRLQSAFPWVLQWPPPDHAQGVFPWGSEWPPPVGAGNYHFSLQVDSYDGLSPVEAFHPNKFGIYDLGGNARQWCEDYYDGTLKLRVMRGASFATASPQMLLSSHRDARWEMNRGNGMGFRCVIALGGASRP